MHESVAMIVPTLLLVYFVCLLIPSLAQARLTLPASGVTAGCRATYSAGPANSTSRPLLLGGVYESCTDGCWPRNDLWSSFCNPHPVGGDNVGAWALCKPGQSTTVRELAKRISGGAPLQFSPCDMHSYLKGRTLWMIGDSHMMNNYFAMRCFMNDLWDHTLGECAASADKQLQAQLFQGTKQGLEGLTGNMPDIQQPRCLHLLEGGRICLVHSVRGERFSAAGPLGPEDPRVLPDLYMKFAAPHDIFWVSFGHWHVRMCANFTWDSYTASLENVGKLYQAVKGTFPHLFFSVAPHNHKACTLPAGGTVNRFLPQCMPVGKGNNSANIGQTVAALAEEVLGRYGVAVVDNYRMTRGLHAAHVLQGNRGTMDCSHYCRPGYPELELWHMFSAFNSYNVSKVSAAFPAGVAAGATTTYKQPECVTVPPLLPMSATTSSASKGTSG